MIDEAFLKAQRLELEQNIFRIQGAINFCVFLQNHLTEEKAKEEKAKKEEKDGTHSPSD